MPTPTRNGDASMRAAVPYAATLGWYAVWYVERLSGLADSEAAAVANCRCRMAGKDFARMSIGDTDSPTLLSVAVEGGASSLKRAGAERRAALSLHGRWPHVHLGALEARYGRAPYYQHVMPGLRRILDSVAPSDSLAEFTLRVHRCLSGFLQVSGEMRGAAARAEVLSRGRELALALDVNLSVIDALMRHGPETALALVALGRQS